MRVLLLKERDGSEIPNMTTKSQLKKCCGQNMPLDHELMPLARQKMPLQKQFFFANFKLIGVMIMDFHIMITDHEFYDHIFIFQCDQRFHDQ